MRVPQGKGYNAVNDPRSSREVNSVEASATVNADNNGKDVVIAVMGATGTGKTTFVNAASGANFEIGTDLMSCTSAVEITSPFLLDGRRARLIDTPGFDDSTVSDADILQEIAAYLRVMYEDGYKLTGIVYLHRISDVRMGGIARRNFGMFRKLCGDEGLKNVVIATTRWDSVDLSVGEAREQQLGTAKELFQPALAKGARLVRVTDASPEAARTVLRTILGQTPIPVLIQKEMVDQGRNIIQTSAGQKLISEGSARVERLQSQLVQLTADIQAADEVGDEETREELEEDRHGLVLQIASNQVDPDRLREQYEATAEDLRRKLRELREALREEQLANSQSQRARAEHGDSGRMEAEETEKLRRTAAEEARKAAEAERKAADAEREAADAERKAADAERKAAHEARTARNKAQEYRRKLEEMRKAAEEARKAAKDTEEEYRRKHEEYLRDQQQKKTSSCTIF